MKKPAIPEWFRKQFDIYGLAWFILLAVCWMIWMIVRVITPHQVAEAGVVPAWKGIIVHITDSEKMTKEDCDDWHRARGWQGCGYNYFISPSGDIIEARGDERVGAHAQGHNSENLGIAFVTRGHVSERQIRAYGRLLGGLRQRFGELAVRPHYVFNPSKKCPGREVWEKVREM